MSVEHGMLIGRYTFIVMTSVIRSGSAGASVDLSSLLPNCRGDGSHTLLRPSSSASSLLVF